MPPPPPPPPNFCEKELDVGAVVMVDSHFRGGGDYGGGAYPKEEDAAVPRSGVAIPEEG